MAGKLGRFQMKGFEHWKGTSTDNHISAAYGSNLQKATDLMVELLAFQNGNTLDTFLSKFPVREFESDEEYYWDVIGSARRNIMLVEARDINGVVVTSTSANVGVNTEPFYLVYNEDWFAKGEVIVGNLNQAYPFRVIEEARPEGSLYVYKVEVMGGISTGVPAERLLAGERFSVDFAPVERYYSKKVGDIRMATPVAMRNEFTHIRIQHKVPGNMLDKKLAVGIPMVKEVGGRVVKDVCTKWMHNVEYEVEKQFNEYKNNALAFGTSNRNANGEYMNFGESGVEIRTGAGLFEQMEVGNTSYLHKFSLKALEEKLMHLSTSKLDLKDRVFLLKTGQWGAYDFHKEVLKEASGWTQFVLDNSSVNVVSKVSSPLHSNALRAGFQFVEFQAPNGIILKLDVDDFYDDPVRNKIMHPEGGVAMSRRYDIFDLGTSDQPNIFKCVVKGVPEFRGIQSGFRDPFTGSYSNNHMSHSEDSATIHRMTRLGACVLDSTRTESIIPAILAV